MTVACSVLPAAEPRRCAHFTSATVIVTITNGLILAELLVEVLVGVGISGTYM